MTTASPLDFLLQALAGGELAGLVPPPTPTPGSAPAFGTLLESAIASEWQHPEDAPAPDLGSDPADLPGSHSYPEPGTWALPPDPVSPLETPAPEVGEIVRPVPTPVESPVPAPAPTPVESPVAVVPPSTGTTPPVESSEPELPRPAATMTPTPDLPRESAPAPGTPTPAGEPTPAPVIPEPKPPVVMTTAPAAVAVAPGTAEAAPAPEDGLGGVDVETAAPTLAVAARAVPSADLTRVRVRLAEAPAEPVKGAVAQEIGRRTQVRAARIEPFMAPQVDPAPVLEGRTVEPESPWVEPTSAPEPVPPTSPPPSPAMPSDSGPAPVAVATPELPPLEVAAAPPVSSMTPSVNTLATPSGPPPTSLHAEILGQVAESMTATAKDALVSSAGKAEATVHINPPQFGEMKVQVQVDPQERVHITLEVMETAALEVLEAEADELLDSLLVQKLDVAGLSIRGDANPRSLGDRSPSDAWTPTPERDRRPGDERPEHSDRSPYRRSSTPRDGGVDTQA